MSLSTPARSPVTEQRRALLLIDVINHFEFPDGKRTLRNSLPIAPRLVNARNGRRAQVFLLYMSTIISASGAQTLRSCWPIACGRKFVETLQPDNDFVLKPMHSAFYQTPLETLLRYLCASSLILCGLATNICTAHHANMRDFRLFVPSDCCGARTGREHQQAIRHIQGMADVKTISSLRLQLDRLEKTR